MSKKKAKREPLILRIETDFVLMAYYAGKAAASGALAPQGSKKTVTGNHLIFAKDHRGHLQNDFGAPAVEKWEVWLCTPEDSPSKVRKLHEHLGGATAAKVCQEFAMAWTPDAEVMRPPECPADGKTIKPPVDHPTLF